MANRVNRVFLLCFRQKLCAEGKGANETQFVGISDAGLRDFSRGSGFAELFVAYINIATSIKARASLHNFVTGFLSLFVSFSIVF